MEKGEEKTGLRKIQHVFSSVFRGFSIDALSEDRALLLAQDPRVRYVEAVLKAHTSAVAESIQTSGGVNCYAVGSQSCTPTPCGVGPTAACAPWDLDRLDQVTGLDGAFHYYATGAGVTIWIIDTGLEWEHKDFGGRAGNSVINIQGDGANFAYAPTVDTNPNNDVCGHGTSVASAAAGVVAGTAKGAKLIGINVYLIYADNCDTPTTTAQLIAAVDYVINNKSAGPNIINMSIIVYTSDAKAPSFETAVSQAMQRGITVVSAAGNTQPNSISACGFDPGRMMGVINVGAATQKDTEAVYSNYGPCVTLLAPGDHVTTADNGRNVDRDGPPNFCGYPHDSIVGYCTSSGTSLSSPLVAGIAALYLQNNPGATPAQVFSAVTSSAVKGVLGILPDKTPNLLSSSWMPGNYSGSGPPPTGNGEPPGFAGHIIVPSILAPLLLQHH